MFANTFILVNFGRMTWKQGTGFPLFVNQMNNLVIIREKIKKAERRHKAKLLATINGKITPYRPTVFEKRKMQALKQIQLSE